MTTADEREERRCENIGNWGVDNVGESLSAKHDPMARTYWIGLHCNLAMSTAVKKAAKSRYQKLTK